MRRALALAALALALGAGSAAADTFEVVPEDAVRLPSAETPNAPGSLLLPTNAFSAPLGLPQERTYEELRALWVGAGDAYGIPWQVLAAINKIESNFGRNMGPSSAGAVGWMQFMPETWLRWGTDGDGNGIADPWSPDDAIVSAARYLAAAGGRADVPRAIFAYNHAQWYVDDVLELAAVFGGDGAGADAAFALDRLGVELEAAQQSVAAAGDALRLAEERQVPLEQAAMAASARAADPSLILSDLLPAQKAAFEADALRLAGEAEIELLRQELESAETALEEARSGTHAASFNPAAAGLLGGPSRADGYVFPVGGGPALVSVGHEHHDYPAADIAAPLGSPVYALADALVVEPVDDARCGIGILLQTSDGLRWVYCHLSYRDPAVLPGAFLGAGQPVGLVGSTGRSSGPHLHLALKPETRFPQEQPWFAEFAGTAFRWADAPTEIAVREAPVFAAEPSEGAPVVEFTLSRSRG
jgi:murein DD-endopeptidase MepM/ murein hydrolase activator NlpD